VPQVALVYCEHLSQNGEVDLVVDTADSGRYVVAARQDFASQILAYRDQARTAMKNLVAQLARDRADLSTKVPSELFVQFFVVIFSDNVDSNVSNTILWCSCETGQRRDLRAISAS